MEGIINWGALQKRMFPQTPSGEKERQAWDAMAPIQQKLAELEGVYSLKQIAAMRINLSDTVLDIGCGTGRLAIPIARQVRCVTALDFSQEMLKRCRTYAAEEQVQNMTYQCLDWKRIQIGKEIRPHDIVISSRSVGEYDIEKLNQAAKKRVYVILWAKAPTMKMVYEDLYEGVRPMRKSDTKSMRMFGYNILFNTLYDMGIDPTVEFLEDGFSKDYANRQTAYGDLLTMGKVPKSKQEQFFSNIDRYLSENEDGSVRFCRSTKSVMISWSPNRK